MPSGRVVLATGAFDVLHIGHLKFLEGSKKAGGRGARLVVVIARDKTVRKRKGRKPVMPESQRRQLVAALKPVSRAILGREEGRRDFLGILQTVKPHIICVGYDQNDIKAALKRIIRREKLPIQIVQLPKFGLRSLDSSSGVKRRIVKSWS